MVHHYLTQSAAAKTSLIGHTVHRTLCARQPHTVATVSTVAARRTLHTTPPPAFTVTTSNHTSHQPGRNIAHNTKGIGHTEQTVSTSVCPAAAAARRHLWTQAPIQSKSFSRLQSIHSNCKPFRPLAVNIRGFYSQSEPQELDDVVSFYDDKVSQYASQEIQTVTLKTLLGLGRSGSSTPGSASAVSEDGQQQINDLAINLDVARYARKELPVRLARLIKATQKLPFIVGTNPYIKRVYRLYYDSFQTITASPEQIRDKEDLDHFADLLQGLVSSHADVIPMLSQGFQECKKYMNTEDIKEFLDEMIQARIGIRLIAEQVISLREQRDHGSNEDRGQQQSNTSSSSSSSSSEPKRPTDVVGVVHTELRPADLIKTCASFVQELCDVNYGSSPEVVINGQTDTTFTYVPVHLEYILCEVLKNALRATVEHSQKIGRSSLDPFGRHKHSDGRPLFSSAAMGSDRRSENNVVIVNQNDDQDITKRANEFGHPPVEVTIAQGGREITIRIRDQGGGISREHFDNVFDYSFTTVKHENDADNSMDAGAGDSPYGVDSIFKGVSRLAMQAGLGGPIAGLGFGLPLTRIYARYFGGDMQLISLQGYGCDVFLKLKQIDETLEDIQI